MAEISETPVAAPVTDRRPIPPGVLPRGVQTWLMAGLAGTMLLIIVLTGRPEAPTPTRSTPMAPTAANPDRIREYQDRLRLLDAQAAAQSAAPVVGDAPIPTTDEEEPEVPRVDPVDTERRRREYDSLFASNVVISRRPETDRPDGGSTTRGRAVPAALAEADAVPSVDAIADAVVRATARHRPGTSPEAAPASPSAAPRTEEAPTVSPTSDHASSPNRVLEGTLVDAVLTHRLDGALAAPVSCLVTTPIYALRGRDVLIPAGARVLGETRPVQAVGESRLAVVFHRLLMPDGRSVALDQFKGLNQIGDVGLRDRVNHHYWATFGAASAVGLVSGLSQLVGTAGLGVGDGDRTVVVAGNVADAGNQATNQVMTRFLNRLPTVTIREGHRVKVYVTSDLELPVWESGDVAMSRR